MCQTVVVSIDRRCVSFVTQFASSCSVAYFLDLNVARAIDNVNMVDIDSNTSIALKRSSRSCTEFARPVSIWCSLSVVVVVKVVEIHAKTCHVASHPSQKVPKPQPLLSTSFSTTPPCSPQPASLAYGGLSNPPPLLLPPSQRPSQHFSSLPLPAVPSLPLPNMHHK